MKRFLIVGLGNPGTEYEDTRHNIGFKVLDYLSEKSSTSFSVDRYGDIADWRLRGRQIRLLKPSTYMNLSGKAVRYHMQALGITTKELLVLTDDVALPFAKKRLRAKGSDGGHNGLKSIIDLLSTNEFPRLRIGIGNDYPKGRQVDFVLGQWSDEEQSVLPGLIKSCGDCIEPFVFEGLQKAMNRCN